MEESASARNANQLFLALRSAVPIDVWLQSSSLNKSARKLTTSLLLIDEFRPRAFPVSLEAAVMSGARSLKERSQHFPLLLRALGTHE
jgi:hypothetical protein